MGLYIHPRSPYWYMYLEGAKKHESTKIRRDQRSAVLRKRYREQAEDIYHARMTQMARAKVGLPIDTGQLFATFADWYTAHHASKHRASARTAVILQHLRQHFGAMRLVDIKPARWAEYETARLKAGIAISTIGRELAVMKSVLNAAVGEHLEVNPLVHLKRRSPKLPPKRTLTKADEERLLRQFRDPEMHDIYLVAVGTLLRQVNVISLTRRQWHAGRLVVDTKTGPHAITLDGPTTLQRRAAVVLRRRLPKTAAGTFFPRWAAWFARDRDGANACFLKGFRRACGRAGLPWGLKAHGIVFHTATRASGATRMLREHGVDIRTVQLLGNWSSLDQMAAYLGLDLSPQRLKGVQTKTAV